ncbi:MAG: LamG domain-containing protein [Candidatus Pacearchaeota archaeon]
MEINSKKIYWIRKRSTVDSKQLTDNLTVNRKHLIVLIIISVLLISFVAVTIATGFFGINTTKVSSLEKGLVAHYPLDGESEAVKNLVLNTTFGSSSGWASVNTDWTSGKPNLKGVGVDSYIISSSAYLSANKYYKVTIDCIVNYGSAIAGPQNQGGYLLKQTGKHSFYIYSTANKKLLIDNVGSVDIDMIINSIYISEIDIQDITPYSNHGTNYGATLTTGVKGEPNRAYSFDGVDDYIEIFHDGKLDMSSEFTQSLWIKLDSATGNWQALLQNSVGRTSTRQFGSVIGSNMKPYIFATTGGTWKSWMGQTTLNLNEWYNLIFIISPNNKIEIYVNGILDSVFDTTGEISYDPNYLRIGSRYDAEFLKGSISDVRIYNRALSEDEIKLLYESYKPTASISDLNKGLVGHWMLDTENGAKDLTPYGNHGTAQGGITIGGVEDRKGKSDGATNFDGVDDYIDCGNPNILQMKDIFSVSVWFKINDLNNHHEVVRKGAGLSSPGNYGWAISYADTKTIYFDTYESSGTRHNVVLSYPQDNNWHHLVCIFNRGIMSCYLDFSNSKTSYGDFLIGNTGYNLRFSGTSGWQFFSGSISDVRIYNRALSEDEIKLLFDSYKPKEASVGNLNKGLILDMPLTTKYMKSNTIVSDRTPYGNDGTLRNGVNVTNEGAVFDGVNGGMNISNSDSLNLANELTISAWIKSNNFGSGYRVILLKTWNGRSYCFELYSNKLDFSLSQNSATTWDLLSHLQSLNTLNNNEWRHVVATYNGVIGKVYVDGNFDNSKSSSGGPIRSTTSNINIGYSSIQEHINGSISNIKVYNRALSDEEVKLLYEKGRW